MSASKIAPPIRIEIRDKIAVGSAPWLALDLAHTEEQATRKIHSARLGDSYETRAVLNLPLDLPPPPSVTESAEDKHLISRLTSQNMALLRENSALALRLAAFEPKPAPVVDAVTGPTPLPFSVGDYLRDVFTRGIVRVTELNPLGKDGKTPRPGFAWENPSAEPGSANFKGFCGLASVGCYGPVTDDAQGATTGFAIPANAGVPALVASAVAPEPRASSSPAEPAAVTPPPAPVSKKHAPAKTGKSKK